MSNPNKPNPHRKALSFSIWDTGDESSMSNTKQLADVIKAYQQHLADNEGREILWHEAVDTYFNHEIRQAFDQLVTDTREGIDPLNFPAVLPAE